jgi:hypothetical protein
MVRVLGKVTGSGDQRSLGSLSPTVAQSDILHRDVLFTKHY